MRARFALSMVAVCLCSATILLAQDAVKVDPKHYSVVSENDQVRILKVHYGPHEKSVMHSHPDTVAVFLTDAKGQFTFPDSAAATHLPENTGDKDMELIVTELKGKTAKTAKAEPAQPAKK